MTSGGSSGGASAAPDAANVLTTSALPFDGAQGPSATIVRLRDVADIELGAANYSQYSTYDFNTAVGLSVYQLPGTNALDVADAVRQRLKELEPGFPPWVRYEIGYDTTPFIRESVADVITDVVRGDRTRRTRRARVSAGLAGHDPANDRRPRVAGRHLCHHGAPGVQPEQYLAVRPGARHRHRGG